VSESNTVLFNTVRKIYLSISILVFLISLLGIQCGGSVFGIRCFFDPWIHDPDAGSRIPSQYFWELRIIYFSKKNEMSTGSHFWYRVPVKNRIIYNFV